MSLLFFTLTYLPPQFRKVASTLVLKAFVGGVDLGCSSVLEQDSGKLFVYASGFSSREKRFSCVSVAAERVARLLKISFEVVTFEEEATPIYVYYKSGQEEPIPIYCDKGEEVTMKEVYAVLRKMMYVLSFHPRHSTLKAMRNEIMQLS